MKVTSINSKKLGLVGMVVVIGLALALLYIIYYVFNTETQRADNSPVESAQPVEPAPGPVSPEAGAPSAPVTDGGSAPPDAAP